MMRTPTPAEKQMLAGAGKVFTKSTDTSLSALFAFFTTVDQVKSALVT